MSQNNQQGALNRLAGQVRVLLKRVEMLEFEKEKEKVLTPRVWNWCTDSDPSSQTQRQYL